MQGRVWAVAVAILAGAGAAYYLWPPAAETPEPPSPPRTIAPPAAPAPAPAPAPLAIRHPVPESADAAPEDLGQGDAPILKALGDLLGSRWLALVLTDRFIQRIVATIDNLPREQVPPGTAPLKPVGGTFATTGRGDTLAIAPRNATRYAPYVRLAEAVDTAKLVQAYFRFYPLFQQAYEDLGYGHAYFNDRLVEALDDLLAAPEPAPPIRLVQPGVLYEFADADLQRRSAGQKILVRMGRDQAGRVKARLREIRQLVARGGTAP